MNVQHEVIIALIAGLSTFIGAVGVYIKKRLVELDVMRNELTDLKVTVAVLEKEKEIAKRAARNITRGRGDEYVSNRYSKDDES